MIRRFLSNYLPRHCHPFNRLLHLIGVPLSFVAAPVLALRGADWYWHVGCFVGGYLLQFAGHAVEGNDAGEVVFLKRMLGLPYTEYAPGSNSSSTPESSDDTNSAAGSRTG
ncbi:MAG: DUF962 domain-containing protein [Planctomycetaceae bacterium]|nr:DUF962 domain-containing protein [Planctomycetaceae bacterium]